MNGKQYSSNQVQNHQEIKQEKQERDQVLL